jgi:hypothetical protein
VIGVVIEDARFPLRGDKWSRQLRTGRFVVFNIDTLTVDELG